MKAFLYSFKLLNAPKFIKKDEKLKKMAQKYHTLIESDTTNTRWRVPKGFHWTLINRLVAIIYY